MPQYATRDELADCINNQTKLAELIAEMRTALINQQRSVAFVTGQAKAIEWMMWHLTEIIAKIGEPVRARLDSAVSNLDDFMIEIQAMENGSDDYIQGMRSVADRLRRPPST